MGESKKHKTLTEVTPWHLNCVDKLSTFYLVYFLKNMRRKIYQIGVVSVSLLPHHARTGKPTDMKFGMLRNLKARKDTGYVKLSPSTPNAPKKVVPFYIILYRTTRERVKLHARNLVCFNKGHRLCKIAPYPRTPPSRGRPSK